MAVALAGHPGQRHHGLDDVPGGVQQPQAEDMPAVGGGQRGRGRRLGQAGVVGVHDVGRQPADEVLGRPSEQLAHRLVDRAEPLGPAQGQRHRQRRTGEDGTEPQLALGQQLAGDLALHQPGRLERDEPQQVEVLGVDGVVADQEHQRVTKLGRRPTAVARPRRRPRSRPR